MRKVQAIVICYIKPAMLIKSIAGIGKQCLIHYNTILAYTKVFVLHAAFENNLVKKNPLRVPMTDTRVITNIYNNIQ
jgi:hypothetical protein